jgi:parallel beta-helix repeat protein
MVKKICFKKTLVIGLLVLFVGMSIVSASTSSIVNDGTRSRLFTKDPPPIVYVDDDFDENTPGWGYDHFNQITYGIYAVKQGGTVYVASGVYGISVPGPYGFVIDIPVTLIGENRTNTIIEGGAQYPYWALIPIIADRVTITGFTIRQTWQGWFAEGVMRIISSNSIISGNIIEEGRDWGILLRGSNNVISGNIIRNNGLWGIYFADWCGGDNNIIVENTFINNGWGIDYDFCTGVPYIYHNNFINDYACAWPDWVFDDGYPSGGNYWSNFDEPSEGAYDNYSGPEQNIPGSDGIVDTPYVVYGGSEDRYPLMNPWTSTTNCGNVNGDDIINIADVIYLINFLYRLGPEPTPLCLGDVNHNGIVDVGDVVYLNNFLFYGGPAPYIDCCLHEPS